MGIRQQKNDARELLTARDRVSLLSWASRVRNPLRVLMSLTYTSGSLLAWRAIEAVGWTAELIARSDSDRVRDFVRRMLWLMNDESGGLSRHSPEMIGEVLVNVPSLIEEYSGLLPSYLNEEPFEQGAHIAVYRVAEITRQPFAGHVSELSESLVHEDGLIRGYTCLALGALQAEEHRASIERLARDDTEVHRYDFEVGDFRDTTVAAMAERALAALESSGQAA